ncbi:MAG: biotin carboxylase N-terminal domain-containing protein, partial [Pseudomonadota bacterium]
ENDHQSLHIQAADEAYSLGEGNILETYLNQEKILAIAKQTKADAIHPGYGFLSENASFAARVAKAKLIFVGAPIKAIELMGQKDAAKRFMAKHQVPVVPGYQEQNQAIEHLLNEAEKIGYPVLIKAAAGGGGKGMRIVNDSAQFHEQLTLAQREAKASFGDDTVILEKYLNEPRHIEVQIMADMHGKVLHLFERDCSIQRRYQKIIEEAPATHMTTALREKITQAAIDAAKAIDYVGAGTIEFLLDKQQNFYFMEMNTRLQVEHPITEMITGVDLVELQLQVAQGEKIKLEQKQIKIHGHAIETRIYAEDCDNEFLPATGKIERLHWPQADENVRIDTGVAKDATITSFYDPMIAKLIVHAQNRDLALKKLIQAINLTAINGIKNNLDYLSQLLQTQAFQQAQINTHFITNNSPFKAISPSIEVWLLATLFFLLYCRQRAETQFNTSHGSSPWFAYDHFRINLVPSQNVTLEIADQKKTLPVIFAENQFKIIDANQIYHLQGTLDADYLQAELNGQKYQLRYYYKEARLYLYHRDFRCLAIFPELKVAGQPKDEAMQAMQSPLPGTITAIYTKVGDSVETGQNLMVIEAMKMQHTIIAPRDGAIKNIFYQVGDMVEEGMELIEFESEKEAK